MLIEWTTTDSPVGSLHVAACEERLVGLCFEGLWDRRRIALEQRFASSALAAQGCRFVRGDDPAGAVTALAAYFAGDLAAVDALPVETWGTPFQQKVWEQLRLIPCGSTSTYAEIAKAIGKPTAVRAVGAANGANPVGIVVPCHRVIGSDGSLTGFAGGLASKRWLLHHEAVLSDGRHEAVLPGGRHEAVLRDGRHEAVLRDGRHEAGLCDGRSEDAIVGGQISLALGAGA